MLLQINVCSPEPILRKTCSDKGKIIERKEWVLAERINGPPAWSPVSSQPCFVREQVKPVQSRKGFGEGWICVMWG